MDRTGADCALLQGNRLNGASLHPLSVRHPEMLDLAPFPVLDKQALIGACARLPLQLDAGRLQAEVAALPGELWGTRSGRGSVHTRAEAVFLRGYAPAEGDKPIEDRDTFALLPYLRTIIHERVGARPLRCLLARLNAGVHIPPHADQDEYFAKTLRLHAPVTTHARVAMYAGGLTYRMYPGEIWALNNSGVHGVLNQSPTQDRIHVICDFLPDPPLLELLSRAERALGTPDEVVELELSRLHDAAQRVQSENR